MPSATMTSATITSSNVKPRQRRRGSAIIEAFLADLERAVEIAAEDDPSASEVAIERRLERRHLAAREQDQMRLRRVFLFVVAAAGSVPASRGELERRLEDEIAALDAYVDEHRVGQRMAREQAVARRIDPTLLEMIVDVEPVARFGEQDRELAGLHDRLLANEVDQAAQAQHLALDLALRVDVAGGQHDAAGQKADDRDDDQQLEQRKAVDFADVPPDRKRRVS